MVLVYAYCDWVTFCIYLIFSLEWTSAPFAVNVAQAVAGRLALGAMAPAYRLRASWIAPVIATRQAWLARRVSIGHGQKAVARPALAWPDQERW